MNPIVYILASGVLGVAGQILLKRAMTTLGPLSLQLDGLPGLALALVLNPLVVLGLAVYLSGTALWLLALSRVDLSFAYPFASLNYILVLLASWLLLGERPTPLRLAGVALICLGVWAISRSPAQTSLARPRLAAPGRPAVVGGAER
jgi:drug/metabolite transporter (DMT)-like permease